MTWGSIIVITIQLIILWIKNSFERNARIRQQKKEAASMIKQGLKERDPSKITAAFDRVRTMRS